MTDARYTIASPGRGLGLELRASAPHGDTVIAIAANDGERSRQALDELARLANDAPRLRAALKALVDNPRPARGSTPDWEGRYLRYETAFTEASALIEATEPKADELPEIAITWRDENYGPVSGVVAFRCYDRTFYGLTREKVDELHAAYRSAGFSYHDRRASWMAEDTGARKALLTAALAALGYRIRHAGAVPVGA